MFCQEVMPSALYFFLFEDGDIRDFLSSPISIFLTRKESNGAIPSNEALYYSSEALN